MLPNSAVTHTPIARFVFCAGLTATIAIGVAPLSADTTADTQQQLLQLQRQNADLQEQLRRQQALIESLSHKVDEIQHNTDTATRGVAEAESKETKGFGFGKVVISGEGGAALFHSGSRGAFPNAEFRIDEAKLFIDAPVWGDVYFFSELNFASRELADVQVRLGELYVDFENISQLWGCDRMLNLRAGRMDTPFGEEYLVRDAIDNPLISHSLADIWGVDEGIELYGKVGKFAYALALQNGGLSDTRDFDQDKSVAARVGFDPNRSLHFSVSGMRTGDLDAAQDPWSALWFGNGFFRALDTGTASKFHANLVEGDVELRLPHGHVKTFGGYIRYDDNAPNANNKRDVFYYSIEAVHNLVGKLYAGARFSQIFAQDGFPILANGQFGEYFFNYPGPAKLTEEIWRLTLGLGYRWSENLVGKVEYTFEHGKELGGAERKHEDLFAMEVAFKF
jgi:hypothetical protein